MLLRDLQTRTVTFSSAERTSQVVSPGRADYFRDYDQRRANDPMRRKQIREAMARYRQNRRTGA
jgi:hypothetical protein